MTISRYLLICAGLLLIGLSIGHGVKADALDWLYAECAPGSEFRVMYRRQATPKMSRLYAGCRDPDSLMETAYYADLTPEQEKQLRGIGSKALSTSRTWSRPPSITIPVMLVAKTPCDRFYLWADSEGARAPQMTRAQKIRQVCS